MKIGVIGLGLLGGSLAMAAKAQGHAVIAHDIDADCLRMARESGAIDEPAAAVAVAAADLIIVAVPVLSVAAVLANLKPALRPNSIVSDVGSAKRELTAAAKTALGDLARRFAPAHPVAGGENSGFAAARADLFAGCLTVLCDADSDADAAGAVADFWRSLGAEIVRMDAAEHDRVFAVVSHLPHILAYALVGQIGGDDRRDALIRCAAGGFRDFTRIAGSDPTMWGDICLGNRDNILAAIADYQRRLAALAKDIAADDAGALRAAFAEARNLRRELLTSRPPPPTAKP